MTEAKKSWTNLLNEIEWEDPFFFLFFLWTPTKVGTNSSSSSFFDGNCTHFVLSNKLLKII